MSIEKKLVDIHELVCLYRNLDNSKLETMLTSKLLQDLESVLNKHESIYFKAFHNKRFRKNIMRNKRKDKHEEIMSVYSTITSFLPYMLLHNMNVNVREQASLQ